MALLLSGAEPVHGCAVALVVDWRLLDHIEHPVSFLLFLYLSPIKTYVF